MTTELEPTTRDLRAEFDNIQRVAQTDISEACRLLDEFNDSLPASGLFRGRWDQRIVQLWYTLRDIPLPPPHAAAEISSNSGPELIDETQALENRSRLHVVIGKQAVHVTSQTTKSK